ncbi:uncharacterized protein DUF4174 [Neolewinella xylanilytica]|uniref:Uncharacterized protein DUF4174 n=1 Tax=Neolewinella xylanilytica TaxID=1514080 RepID=A0A2S6I938_9BACT|nr:DUF4174 domain-containing protein [Neolewinella xylanilytica]PPK88010.1 uncharacterized protein DUF4174 [Neolewinella xylanilytica]
MKLVSSLLVFLALPLCLSAQSLNEFRWKSRVIILFAPSLDDPLFLKQYAALDDAREALQERRTVVLMVTPEGVHENSGLFLAESSSEYFYNQFSAQPYQLELSLVGLDGTEKYRAKNTVTPVSVLLELVDGMPMRQRELQRGTGNRSQINSKDPTPDIPDGKN